MRYLPSQKRSVINGVMHTTLTAIIIFVHGRDPSNFIKKTLWHDLENGKTIEDIDVIIEIWQRLLTIRHIGLRYLAMTRHFLFLFFFQHYQLLLFIRLILGKVEPLPTRKAVA